MTISPLGDFRDSAAFSLGVELDIELGQFVEGDVLVLR